MASQPEFLLASLAFILLMMIPATTILVNQSYLVFQTRVEESREDYIRQLVYGLLYLPGDPADWGKSSIIPNIIGFSSPYAYGTLDPHKIQRLCVRNLNYLDYQTFSQIMNLESLRMQIKVLPPFNVSIDYNINRGIFNVREDIIVNVSTWLGSPLPYVDLSIILIKERRGFFGLHQYFYIENYTGITDNTGIFTKTIITPRRNWNPTAAIIVLAKYQDSLFAPAYYNVYEKYPILRPLTYDPTIQINASFVKKIEGLFQFRYGNFEANVSVYPTFFISVVNVTTIMISPDLQYICTNSSEIQGTSGNTSVNVLSRKITFIFIYAYLEWQISPLLSIKLLRKFSIFVWPPFVGYFTDDDPAYGPQLSNPNVIHQEIMLIDGIPCLVVVECEYE